MWLWREQLSAGGVGFSGLAIPGVKSRPLLWVGGQAVESNWSSSQRRAGWLACQPMKRQQDEGEEQRRDELEEFLLSVILTLLV